MLISIQYLRALAAIAVVLFHFYPIFFSQSRNLFASGSAGVDVFFVISGFIMWHITNERELGPGEFLKNRLIRVAPLYWIVTAVLAVSTAMKPALFPYHHADLMHIALSLLFIPQINPITSDIGPILTQGWTLEYEVLFYLLFAVALLFAASKRLVILSLFIITPVAIGTIISPTNPYLAWLLSPLLVEFYLGVLIAIMVRREILLSKNLAVIVIAASVVSLIVLTGEAHRLIAWGIPSSLIVWSLVSIEKANALTRSRLLLVLGDASYSIYLTHMLASSAVTILLGAAGFTVTGFLPFVGALLLALAGGILSYLCLERPIARALKSKPYRVKVAAKC